MENENLITVPTIKIDGKVIKPAPPKMKAWRKFLEFYEKDEEELKSMTLSEYTDALIDLIVIGFNQPEITAEKVEEILGISELKPLSLKIFRWLQRVFFLGLDSIPNVEEAAEV